MSCGFIEIENRVELLSPDALVNEPAVQWDSIELPTLDLNSPNSDALISSKLWVIYTSYRVVLCLDMSPSLAMVDLITGTLLFEKIFHHLQQTLENLVKPFHFTNAKLKVLNLKKILSELDMSRNICLHCLSRNCFGNASRVDSWSENH